MTSTDQNSIEKVLSILSSKNEEAKKQLEQTIVLLYLHLQSNNDHGQDIPDKIISFKNVACLKDHMENLSQPGGGEVIRQTSVGIAPVTSTDMRKKYEQDINCR